MLYILLCLVSFVTAFIGYALYYMNFVSITNEFFELLNCHILLYFYYILFCTVCQCFWYNFLKNFYLVKLLSQYICFSMEEGVMYA